MNVKYDGELRTTGTHLSSGTKIQTDAPLDNKGKGALHSPTDMVCSALASCMITLMGICANNHDFQLGEINASIEKIMESNPRRIGTIKINLILQSMGWTAKQKKLLEHAATTCPVALSLSKEIKQDVTFTYE